MDMALVPYIKTRGVALNNSEVETNSPVVLKDFTPVFTPGNLSGGHIIGTVQGQTEGQIRENNAQIHEAGHTFVLVVSILVVVGVGIYMLWAVYKCRGRLIRAWRILFFGCEAQPPPQQQPLVADQNADQMVPPEAQAQHQQQEQPRQLRR